MAEGTAKKHDTAAAETQDLTDGFQLVIDALKLNDLNTIYGVPGIPITDLGRMAQAAGIRVLSFRHEQNAGYAAAIAGFLTKKPGICLTVSAPGSGMSLLYATLSHFATLFGHLPHKDIMRCHRHPTRCSACPTRSMEACTRIGRTS